MYIYIYIYIFLNHYVLSIIIFHYYALVNNKQSTKIDSPRLDAIDNLLNCPGKVKEVQTVLRKVPDLERLLRKVHTQGVKIPADHPESRAVLYDMEIYSKKKIVDLVSLLDGKWRRYFLELPVLWFCLGSTSESYLLTKWEIGILGKVSLRPRYYRDYAATIRPLCGHHTATIRPVNGHGTANLRLSYGLDTNREQVISENYLILIY